MKYLLISGILLLSACSNSNHMNKQDKIEQEKAAAFTQKQKMLSTTYSKTDPAVKLSPTETLDILKTLYPKMIVHNMSKEEFTLTNSSNDKTIPFKNWESIKIFSIKNVTYILVEAYSEVSRKESKKKTFELCKNIWKNLDHRIPPVIDQLATHLDENEDRQLPLIVNELEYGYTFYANSKGYADGYPIGCGIIAD